MIFKHSNLDLKHLESVQEGFKIFNSMTNIIYSEKVSKVQTLIFKPQLQNLIAKKLQLKLP